MPTTPSAKTKSPHGSSGPEDSNQVVADSPGYQEETENCEKPPTPESDQPAAVAVDDSGDTVAVSPISETDRKLATRMTRAIADHLGLSGRSRSVRV
jgi:hypothetical protein